MTTTCLQVIPYKLLQEKLDVSNVRELEDLIIDSIYQGLLTGRLNQAKAEVQVSIGVILLSMIHDKSL